MPPPRALLCADQSVVELERLWETGVRSMELLTWLIESALQDDTLSDIYESLSRGDIHGVRMLAHRMAEDLCRIRARSTVRALRKVARKPVSGVEEMRLLVDDARAHSERLRSELVRAMETGCCEGPRFSAMAATMRPGVR